MSRRESAGAIWSKPWSESARAGQGTESRERLQISGGGTPQMVLTRALAGTVGLWGTRLLPPEPTANPAKTAL